MLRWIRHLCRPLRRGAGRDRFPQRNPQQPKIFKLPIDAARLKAREIINQVPQGNYTPIVENWRQLPNGQIEFTMRHLPTAD
jgi:hypothetical protein